MHINNDETNNIKKIENQITKSKEVNVRYILLSIKQRTTSKNIYCANNSNKINFLIHSKRDLLAFTNLHFPAHCEIQQNPVHLKDFYENRVSLTSLSG